MTNCGDAITHIIVCTLSRFEISKYPPTRIIGNVISSVDLLVDRSLTQDWALPQHHSYHNFVCLFETLSFLSEVLACLVM